LDQFAHVFASIDGLEAQVRRIKGLFEECEHKLQREVARFSSVGDPIPVVYVIWREPWMTISSETYISDCLARVGFRTVIAEKVGDNVSRYPTFEWGEFAAKELGAVLLSSEPYRFGAADCEAIRKLGVQCPVLLIDGEMTSWYGSRAIQGMEYLMNFRRLNFPDLVSHI
jgi:hypothetical protein